MKVPFNLLTEMPATATNDPKQGNAGPTFELHGSLQLSTQQSNRWLILNERLDAITNEAANLSSLNQRLKFISENILLIKQNIEQTLISEEKL